jgi:diguanylate cyclase (GGDEF)-like protein
MRIPKPELTIFQKMLVAPLLGVLFYSAYVLFIYSEYPVSRSAIKEIRAVYLPALEFAGSNVILFDSITGAFKDAVLAGEEEWVRNTDKKKAEIERNLAQLSTYAPIIDVQEVKRIKLAFGLYYGDAYALSMMMLHGDGDAGAEKVDHLIDHVERHHDQVSAEIGNLKANLERRFSQQIDGINERTKLQVTVAAALGLMLIFLVIGVTFIMSISTRSSLREINRAMKNMAQDTPDFSRRLVCESADELGELVGWFNLLSDKLENDYKQIELLSITDKLTQLYNRTKTDELFHIEINKVRRYPGALSVILLDIDHFKLVNDNYGHQMGDFVLQRLANILRNNVRDTDHVGRWGGEEFIVLSPNTNLAQAGLLAEKLRASFASFLFKEVGHQTGSFGVATYQEGDDEGLMTKRADHCLYIAKQQGRNQVVDETSL